VEGDKDRGAIAAWAALHGPGGPGYLEPFPTSAYLFPLTQPGKQLPKMKAGRKKREREEGGAIRSSPARVRRSKSNKETQSGDAIVIAASRCWAVGVRVRVQKTPIVAR
jgi:hypothetical protein